ncbi:MAG: cytochrome c [Pseudomonadota bacterium]
MRRERPNGLATAAIALMVSGGWLAPSPAAADDEAVDKGRYISIAADCVACHQAPDGTPYAGGHVLKTPFGDLAVPNITPDADTGIGSWTYDDFEGAVRRGVGHDGELLYPAMPYPHYTGMTDDDVAALWAYMQTVTPVTNAVDVNRLPFPFDVRDSLYVWRALYFEPARFKTDSSATKEVNRGAYLVEVLGHCGDCHTPRDALGAEIKAEALQGAAIEEWYAPDISNGPDSLIADWSVEQLAAFLGGADQSARHPAFGEMLAVVGELAQLREDDVQAMAAFLKSRTPDEPSQHRSPGHEASADELALGEEIFVASCTSCHQTDGEGDPGLAASLVGNGGVIAAQPFNVIAVVLEGMAPQGDYGVMPSFHEALTDSQIAAVTNYVRTAWTNEAPANATPAMVADLRQIIGPIDGTATVAVTCPNPPADRMNDTTRTALTELAKSRQVTADDLRPIVAAYDESFPDLSTVDRVAALTGVYCVAAAADATANTQVLAKQVHFMNAVARVEAEQQAQQ